MAQAKEDQAALGQTTETSDFSALLKKEFKPKSDRAREEVETAVRTLAAQVLEDKDLIADDAVNSINAIVAEIDRKLAEQINLIMHNPHLPLLSTTSRPGLHLPLHNIQHKSLHTFRRNLLSLRERKHLSIHRIKHRYSRQRSLRMAESWKHMSILHCIDCHKIEILFVLLCYGFERRFVGVSLS